MRQFDPWPVFFKREWGRNWPFLAGLPSPATSSRRFRSASVVKEDAKNSPFVQKHRS
ncbi:unnamed protein product [Spirodela intermedia]|uniref:Uncharacterized protein n=1 Tax=Spirodela intermedia TaxID=51605 RepID=A0A7I8KKE1_SPIIN|nr:unnamed protein product [Spirodela intermedia]